jgi:hypothetical protein
VEVSKDDDNEVVIAHQSPGDLSIYCLRVSIKRELEMVSMTTLESCFNNREFVFETRPLRRERIQFFHTLSNLCVRRVGDSGIHMAACTRVGDQSWELLAGKGSHR